MNTVDDIARQSKIHAGETSTLDAARRGVVAFLTAHDMPAAVQDWARLVVSELATNAIQFSPGSPYTVGVELTADRRTTTLAVRSVGTAKDIPLGTLPTDDPDGRLGSSGRGLKIVRAMSGSLDVVDNRDGTISVVASRPAG